MNVTTFSYEAVIGLCIIASLFGFLIGCLPGDIKTMKLQHILKNKPLCYRELSNLPIGTDVYILDIGWKDNYDENGEPRKDVYKREATVCMHNNHKVLCDGDSYAEFTDVDAWLKR